MRARQAAHLLYTQTSVYFCFHWAKNPFLFAAFTLTDALNKISDLSKLLKEEREISMPLPREPA
jgi:hypothetical protein